MFCCSQVLAESAISCLTVAFGRPVPFNISYPMPLAAVPHGLRQLVCARRQKSVSCQELTIVLFWGLKILKRAFINRRMINNLELN